MGDYREAHLPHDLIMVGDVKMDLRQRVVYMNAEQVALTRREFDMLCLLARHPGWAYTREQLLEAAWGLTAEANHHAVETMIYWLRRKLRHSASVRIQTMVGYGYRLVVMQDQKPVDEQ